MKRISWISVCLTMICSILIASCAALGGGADSNQGDGNNANADNGNNNGDNNGNNGNSENGGDADGNSGNDSGGEASVDLVLPIDVSDLILMDDFEIYADSHDGWVTVHKHWQVGPSTYVIQDGEIPFMFVPRDSDTIDFSKPVPIIGYGDGSIELQIYGEGTGGSCITSSIGSVKYEFRGAFYANQCTIWFNIIERVGSMDVIDECSGGLVLKGTTDPYSIDLFRDFYIQVSSPLLVENYPSGKNLWYLKRWNPENSSGVPCGTIDMEIDVDIDTGEWDISDDMKPFIEEIEIEINPVWGIQ